ncbi:ANK_REP_REGION domain-containing protein [Durusdinium trenchii]|uniref:ANK_REP_REGION domain-containing protein n=1 Tax=Durusdinium trenchii TaxID=1381693 RepID=A0ABP0LCK7_9DINO
MRWSGVSERLSVQSEKSKPQGPPRQGRQASQTSMDSVEEILNQTRRRSMEYRDSQVDIFLKENGFREVNAPRPGLCLCGQERIYPIHLAAVKGNHQVLLMLLSANADPLQESSRGRTPFHFAKHANKDGSHKGVLELLQQLTFSRTRSFTDMETPSQEHEEGADEEAPAQNTLGNLDTLLAEEVQKVDM